MSEAAERIRSQLSGLPPEDRAEVAHFLLESLDDGEDPDAEAALDAELARRAEEIKSGKVVGIPRTGGRVLVPAIKTGKELVAYWQTAGVVGSRKRIKDSQKHARQLREKAQKKRRRN